MSAPAPAPISIYGQLRMGSRDSFARVVYMDWWRTTHRRERRRWFKKLLLAGRDVTQEPYHRSDAVLVRKK